MDDQNGNKGVVSRLKATFALSRDFAVLVLALVIVSLGFGLLTPLLPLFGEILEMSPSALGVAFGLFSLSFIIALPPSGLLADKIGRKRMIISGILLFGVTTFLMVLIPEPYQFALLRVLEGIGAAMVTPAAFALTLDIVPEGKRGVAMGAEGTAQLLGAMAGPAIGGILAGEVNFYMPFYIAAILAVVCAIVVYFIREPKVPRSTTEKVRLSSMIGAWKSNAGRSRALIPLTIRGGVMGVVQSLWAFGLILFWSDMLDMDETAIGVAMSLGMATMAVGTIPFGVLSDRYGRKPFVILGGVLMAGGLAPMVLATHVWQVYVLIVISEFGAAVSNPSVGAMLGDVIDQSQRASVMGAYSMVQGVGNMSGYFALGVMYERIGPWAPILACSGALATATSIIALFVGETHTSGKRRIVGGGGPDTPVGEAERGGVGSDSDAQR
ncbi:TPA: MFS transporter [Thermoplasmata archaeon]|nr:MFS transporter [Thermoplasmata archaeon]